MANRLMELVANHGTGNDILALAKLIKSADPNANVPYTPLMQINHQEDNVYTALGFSPSETFKAMHNVMQGDYDSISKAVEAMLQDQKTVEQMATLMMLLCNKLPLPMIAMALGGSLSEE